MALLEDIVRFFDNFANASTEQRIGTAVELLLSVTTPLGQASIMNALTDEIKGDPRVQAAAEETGRRLGLEGDAGPFGSVPSALVKGFAALEPGLEAGIVSTLNSIFETSATTIPDVFEDVLNKALIGAFFPGMDTTNPTHQDFIDKIKSSLFPVITSAITFTVASILADQIHPVKNPGLQTAMRTLQDIVGYQALSNAYGAPIRHATIEVPTTQTVNAIFQPYHVDPRVASLLVRKRRLTIEDYADLLRINGIREKYIPGLTASVWRDFRVVDLQRIYDFSRPEESWVTEKIKQIGYSDDDTARLLETLKKRTIDRDLGDLRVLQRSQFKRGVITRDQYERALADRGISFTESRVILDAVELERKDDQAASLIKLYETRYLYGRMDDPDLLQKLQDLGMSEALAITRIDYLRERKLGKLVEDLTDRILTRADLVALYKKNLITKADLVRRLDDLGYELADAQLVADQAERDILDDVTSEWIRAAEQRTLSGRMALSDLQAAYIELGKSEEWAVARAAYMEERVLGKEETA